MTPMNDNITGNRTETDSAGTRHGRPSVVDLLAACGVLLVAIFVFPRLID